MELLVLIEGLERQIEELREEIDRLDNYSGKEQLLFKKLSETQKSLEIAKALQG